MRAPHAAGVGSRAGVALIRSGREGVEWSASRQRTEHQRRRLRLLVFRATWVIHRHPTRATAQIKKHGYGCIHAWTCRRQLLLHPLSPSCISRLKSIRIHQPKGSLCSSHSSGSSASRHKRLLSATCTTDGLLRPSMVVAMLFMSRV